MSREPVNDRVTTPITPMSPLSPFLSPSSTIFKKDMFLELCGPPYPFKEKLEEMKYMARQDRMKRLGDSLLNHLSNHLQCKDASVLLFAYLCLVGLHESQKKTGVFSILENESALNFFQRPPSFPSDETMYRLREEFEGLFKRTSRCTTFVLMEKLVQDLKARRGEDSLELMEKLHQDYVRLIIGNKSSVPVEKFYDLLFLMLLVEQTASSDLFGQVWKRVLRDEKRVLEFHQRYDVFLENPKYKKSIERLSLPSHSLLSAVGKLSPDSVQMKNFLVRLYDVKAHHGGGMCLEKLSLSNDKEMLKLVNFYSETVKDPTLFYLFIKRYFIDEKKTKRLVTLVEKVEKKLIFKVYDCLIHFLDNTIPKSFSSFQKRRTFNEEELMDFRSIFEIKNLFFARGWDKPVYSADRKRVLRMICDCFASVPMKMWEVKTIVTTFFRESDIEDLPIRILEGMKLNKSSGMEEEMFSHFLEICQLLERCKLKEDDLSNVTNLILEFFKATDETLEKEKEERIFGRKTYFPPSNYTPFPPTPPYHGPNFSSGGFRFLKISPPPPPLPQKKKPTPPRVTDKWLITRSFVSKILTEGQKTMETMPFTQICSSYAECVFTVLKKSLKVEKVEENKEKDKKKGKNKSHKKIDRQALLPHLAFILDKVWVDSPSSFVLMCHKLGLELCEEHKVLEFLIRDQKMKDLSMLNRFKRALKFGSDEYVKLFHKAIVERLKVLEKSEEVEGEEETGDEKNFEPLKTFLVEVSEILKEREVIREAKKREAEVQKLENDRKKHYKSQKESQQEEEEELNEIEIQEDKFQETKQTEREKQLVNKKPKKVEDFKISQKLEQRLPREQMNQNYKNEKLLKIRIRELEVRLNLQEQRSEHVQLQQRITIERLKNRVRKTEGELMESNEKVEVLEKHKSELQDQQEVFLDFWAFERSLIGKKFKHYKLITLKEKDGSSVPLAIGGKAFGAEGVNGVVYEVQFRGRKLAMKIILNIHSSQSSLIRNEYINREFLYRIPIHPNICRIHHCFVEELTDDSLKMLGWKEKFDDRIVGRKTAIFIMPLHIPGGLYEVKKKHSLPVFNDESFLKFVTHMCRAIVVLQKHFIVHRDLKPSNILLDFHSNFLLADFGGSLDYSDFSFLNFRVPKTVCGGGTPIFNPPEIWKNTERIIPLDKWDVFSLGIVCYQLFAKPHPYDENNTIVYRELKEEECGNKEIRELIRKMLSISYEERSSAKEVLKIIENMKL